MDYYITELKLYHYIYYDDIFKIRSHMSLFQYLFCWNNLMVNRNNFSSKRNKFCTFKKRNCSGTN